MLNRKTSTLCDATFTTPDLTTSTRLNELGLVGLARDSVIVGWRTSRSGGAPPRCWFGSVCRYQRRRYAHVWGQVTIRAVEPRAKICRCGLQWGLERLVLVHLSVARVAAGLGVVWNTANDATSAGTTVCGTSESTSTPRAPHPQGRRVGRRDHRPNPGP